MAESIRLDVMDKIFASAESTRLGTDESVATVAKSIINRFIPEIRNRLIEYKDTELPKSEAKEFDELLMLYIPGAKIELLSIRRRGFFNDVVGAIEVAQMANQEDRPS